MTVTSEKEILGKLKTLRYKDDSIILTDVYPAVLESIFDFNGGVRIIGGRDLDYEGETDEYIVSGSAYYGTCEFVKKYGETRPNEEMDCVAEIPKQEDKYTRTSFEFKGRMIEHVPPAILCSNTMLLKIKQLEYKSGPKIKMFYIGFSRYGITMLHPFYANNERDVRYRALSIWGKYDDVYTKSDIERRQLEHGDEYFDHFYTIDEKVYVLLDEEIKGEIL